jgi:hypothetical protein
MLIKTSFPKLRLFYSISNNGVQRIHTNNIAIGMQILFYWFNFGIFVVNGFLITCRLL